MPTDGPIVVGVDGSPSSLAAVRHAARLAERRQVPLHLVHAYQYPIYGYAGVGFAYPTDVNGENYRDAVEQDLGGLVQRIHKAHPGVVGVHGEQVNGSTASVLLELARGASVTVLGSRGHGGFAELLLGSVSTQVATHAHGPVIVVREAPEGAPERSEGSVVVGYDGSAGADPALRFAADEALSRGVPLNVVRFYTPEIEGARELAELTTTDVAEQLAVSHPALDVDARALPGESAAVGLIELSLLADLTVVGSRGHGGFADLLVGSVGRGLLHHAQGPVAVVHPTDEERKTS